MHNKNLNYLLKYLQKRMKFILSMGKLLLILTLDSWIFIGLRVLWVLGINNNIKKL